MRERTVLLVAIASVAVFVTVIVLVFLWVFDPKPTTVTSPSTGSAAPTWAPPGSAPLAAAEPGVGMQGRVDAEWVEQTAAATGIPARALAAYAGAAIFKAQEMPECGISWSTLAGVGAIESDHGRYGGSSLDAAGNAVPPIFGVALDGGNTAEITDTDGGTIDGDAEFDRAVGPMQLIPQTWRNWHTDGGGDGVEDPQNIDDAVAAAANYLCRSSVAMDTEAGWRAAISAYNSSDTYLSNVAAAAVAYTVAAG